MVYQRNGEQPKRNNNGNRNGGNHQNSRGGGGGGRGGRGGKKPQTSRPPRQHNTKVDMKKYERMITAAHTNFSDIPCGPNSRDCDICCKPNDVFGIGPCRHPICVECAIRMRILSDVKTCPVCRADIETLSFVTLDQDTTTIPVDYPLSGHSDENRYGVRFSNETAGKKYEKYLAHVCKICKAPDGDRLEFASFMSLRQHMASKHDQTYCHICTENLNQFSRERKTYTRDQLQRHMKTGDFDDKSFKGHPLCFFCEQKFFDEENRYRHLRKEHFFCQFCESDGTMTNVFFGKHDELKKHYKEHHYICESEECKTMGIAFASKFELDLHMANEHSEKRNLIELGFGQRPQADSYDRRGQRNGRVADSRLEGPVPRERIAMVKRQVATNPQSDPSEFTTVRSAQSKSTFIVNRSAFVPTSQQDFPSLAGSAPAPPPMRSSEFPRLNKVNKPSSSSGGASSSTAPPPEPVEHFPSLGEGSAPLLRIKVPPLAKKRQPPPPVQQKSKPAPRAQHAPAQNRPRDEEDELEYSSSRRDVPQAVVKVNNAKLRFDTVDDRAPVVAKSNIQMIKREDSRTSTSSGGAAAPGRMDFPALPAASAPMLPANSSWLNSKNNSKIKSSVIASVSVPQNYSKATQQQGKKKNKVAVPKTEVWSSLGPAPEVFTPAPATDEWQDIPLSKEAQAEKEKRERKEEWARKKAEIQARVAAASAAKKMEVSEVEAPVEAVEEPVFEVPTSPAVEEWKPVTTKAGEAARAAEEKKKNNKKNKNKDKNAPEAPAPTPPKEAPKAEPPKSAPKEAPTPPKTAPTPPKEVPKPASTPAPPKTAPAAPAPEPIDSFTATMNLFQEKLSFGILPSMPSLPSMPQMFSSWSMDSMLGRGRNKMGPPPGLGYSFREDLMQYCQPAPPGLELPSAPPTSGAAPSTSNEISFASAPMLSHDDVKEKRERAEAEKKRAEEVKKEGDDGWTTTGKAKQGGKKNKNKK